MHCHSILSKEKGDIARSVGSDFLKKSCSKNGALEVCPLPNLDLLTNYSARNPKQYGGAKGYETSGGNETSDHPYENTYMKANICEHTYESTHMRTEV